MTVQAVMPNPTVTQTAIPTAMQAVNLTTIGAVMVNQTAIQIITPTSIRAAMANLATILATVVQLVTPTPVQAVIHYPIVTQTAIPTAT